jgi:Predicted metal-binding, possibly nucleic acid-binding protein
LHPPLEAGTQTLSVEMMKLKEFNIPFSGLKLGKHEFVYEIDNAFFESFEYQEFNGASIHTKVILDKMSTMMELRIEAEGTVNVDCDLTGEPFDQPIESDLHLVIKFGEEYNDEDDEILIIPHGEFQINIAQYIYEMLVLAVPQKRVHPGVEDGTLKSDILDKLEELQPKEQKEPSEKTDPRWDDLKKLLTDK